MIDGSENLDLNLRLKTNGGNMKIKLKKRNKPVRLWKKMVWNEEEREFEEGYVYRKSKPKHIYLTIKRKFRSYKRLLRYWKHQDKN